MELVDTSPVRDAEATTNAVPRAGETLRGLGWFEVPALRGLLDHGAIATYHGRCAYGGRLALACSAPRCWPRQ